MPDWGTEDHDSDVICLQICLVSRCQCAQQQCSSFQRVTLPLLWCWGLGMASPNMLSRQLWLFWGSKVHLNEIDECPSLPWISGHQKEQSSPRKFPCFIASLFYCCTTWWESSYCSNLFYWVPLSNMYQKPETEQVRKCSHVSFPPGGGLLQGGASSTSTSSLWPIPCTKLKAWSQLVSAKVMLLLHIRNSLSLWVLYLWLLSVHHSTFCAHFLAEMTHVMERHVSQWVTAVTE